MSESIDRMKLEPGDVITFGKEYFVYIGYDLNAFQFYGIGDTRFRVSKEDLFKLDGATVIGKVKPGKGIRKRFVEFLQAQGKA